MNIKKPQHPRGSKLQRSVSNINIIDSPATNAPNEEKKNSAIANSKGLNNNINKGTLPKSKPAALRQSIMRRESVMARKLNTNEPLKPVNRPQTKPFQGKNATLKAAALAAFCQLIEEEKENIKFESVHHRKKAAYDRLTVAVRKRPINEAEAQTNSPDIVSIVGDDSIIVHEPKEKVDMTRYIENSSFKFDYAYDVDVDNKTIYK